MLILRVPKITFILAKVNLDGRSYVNLRYSIPCSLFTKLNLKVRQLTMEYVEWKLKISLVSYNTQETLIFLNLSF